VPGFALPVKSCRRFPSHRQIIPLLRHIDRQTRDIPDFGNLPEIRLFKMVSDLITGRMHVNGLVTMNRDNRVRWWG